MKKAVVVAASTALFLSGLTLPAHADLPPGWVIAGRVFEHANFSGASYTLTAPAPCKDNGKNDYWYTLPDHWKYRISSVQTWGNCWMTLYGDNGIYEGPYKEMAPNLGRQINDKTVRIGLG